MDKNLTLDEILERVPEKTCKWCSHRLNRVIDHYPHSGGYWVKGFTEKQWLSMECSNCGYEWSLWKLGFPRESQNKEQSA